MATVAGKGSLSAQLDAVPPRAGIYRFRDAAGAIVYVGKAANLRNRLRSYFGSPARADPRLRQLVERIADFDFTVTESEAEALILENLLIKRHRPRYNARLKDDKTYPYLKIDLDEPFPRVYITRRVSPGGARYFGPFASASSVRRTLDLLKKLFPYRSCTRTITGSDPRPCLEYYINRCVAPCVGYADQEHYRKVIDQVIAFMEGRTGAVVKELRDQMHEASRRWEFERAARVRDQIQAIERVTEGQKVVSMRMESEDVVGLARDGQDEAWIEVFAIRKGKLVSQDHFVMEGASGASPEELTTQFVKQYYDTAPSVPPRVILHSPLLAEEEPVIAEWLAGKRGSAVNLEVPRRGQKRRLVQMVEENATHGLQQRRARQLADQDALGRALDELGEQLHLVGRPHRIECYDISNIRGTSAVGSMVVFQDGQPRRSDYRRFQIRDVSGIDDYGMMREVLRRRFRRLARSTRDEHDAPRAWESVPDLVLLDGGKGHLSVGMEVALELGLGSLLPLAALAKEREELHLPHTPEPVAPPPNSAARFLVQRVRDEAHRFAVSYHQRVRARRSAGSPLDDVPGIGPRRKRTLLRRFGGLSSIRDAPVEELAAAPGMTMTLARRVKEKV